MEIKEERQRARGWSARRREEGESPGLLLEPAASAPGGAEGRAELGALGESSGVLGPRRFPAAREPPE